MTTYESTTRLDEGLLSDLLANVADEIDISEAVYEEATVKYEEVGIWLSEDEDGIGKYSPEIYPQGSFRLGTAVRPLNQDCDYDIDLVCHLDLKKESTTQKDLKEMVGKRLREHLDLAKILSPKRRCWSLTYPRQFHMDVLPSIANVEQPPTGILLTDTELVTWQKSNPKEYAVWFHRAMAAEFERKRADLAKALQASIEDIPEWRVKTPLQRAVQLFKRHRDIYFQGDGENRPVSIIITTLAARAYRSENNVYDALAGLVVRMPRYIECRDGRWWVENPVEPGENFADKWNEYPARRFAFLRWLTRVQEDAQEAVIGKSLREGVEILGRQFGKNAVVNAEKRLSAVFGVATSGMAVATRPLPMIKSDVPHCLAPQWPVQSRYKCHIQGSVHLKERGKKIADLARRRIPKKLSLRFSVQTNAPEPYRIHWQVVNTGQEASLAGQLRGNFYPSEQNARDVRWESTQYSGIHWVEAFIVKDNVCVARSGRKIVNVS